MAVISKRVDVSSVAVVCMWESSGGHFGSLLLPSYGSGQKAFLVSWHDFNWQEILKWFPGLTLKQSRTSLPSH